MIVVSALCGVLGVALAVAYLDALVREDREP